jgi:hypothetical protein
MLSLIRMVSRFLTISVLLTASAFSQSTDITGWSDLPWGTTKSVALKTLQSLGAHQCNRTNSVACAEIITPTKNGEERLKFTKASGALKMQVRGTNAVQLFWLYTNRPDEVIEEITRQWDQR